jgi:hypothetical protein
LVGPKAIAGAIRDNRALTSLNMSANGLKGAEAGKVLGDAIAANTVLTELDITGDGDDNCDVEFVQTFSVGLRDNGALLQLRLSNNSLGITGTQFLCGSLGLSVRCTLHDLH